jgi:hypothetical protein
MKETGPIHGAELVEILATTYKQKGGDRQLMPTRANLESVASDQWQGERLVGAYEVLLNHWRGQADEIDRLQIENKSLREVFERESKPHSQLCLELAVLKNELIAMDSESQAAASAAEGE